MHSAALRRPPGLQQQTARQCSTKTKCPAPWGGASHASEGEAAATEQSSGMGSVEQVGDEAHMRKVVQAGALCRAHLVRPLPQTGTLLRKQCPQSYLCHAL